MCNEAKTLKNAKEEIEQEIALSLLWCRRWDGAFSGHAPPNDYQSFVLPCKYFLFLVRKAKRSLPLAAPPSSPTLFRLYQKEEIEQKIALSLLWCRRWDGAFSGHAPPNDYQSFVLPCKYFLFLVRKAKRSLLLAAPPSSPTLFRLYQKEEIEQKIALSLLWCRRWDLNPHDVTINGF